MAKRSDLLPAAPFRELMLAQMDKFEDTEFDPSPHAAGFGRPGGYWGEKAKVRTPALMQLHFFLEIPERTIYAILSGERDRVTFNMADRIITKIDPSLWHTEPFDGFYERTRSKSQMWKIRAAAAV